MAGSRALVSGLTPGGVPGGFSGGCPGEVPRGGCPGGVPGEGVPAGLPGGGARVGVPQRGARGWCPGFDGALKTGPPDPQKAFVRPFGFYWVLPRGAPGRLEKGVPGTSCVHGPAPPRRGPPGGSGNLHNRRGP